MKRIWKLRSVTVVPIIIGALETISKDIEKWLPEISVTCRRVLTILSSKSNNRVGNTLFIIRTDTLEIK